MTLSAIGKMADDQELLRRAAAAAAEQLIDEPLGWAYRNAWKFAAQPGWGGAWASARDRGTEHIGDDPSVITDAQIRSAVQALAEAEAAEAAAAEAAAKDAAEAAAAETEGAALAAETEE